MHARISSFLQPPISCIFLLSLRSPTTVGPFGSIVQVVAGDVILIVHVNFVLVLSPQSLKSDADCLEHVACRLSIAHVFVVLFVVVVSIHFMPRQRTLVP